MTLQQFFEKNPKVALGFSGGVDSAYLLYAAKKSGADIAAYYVATPFQPRFEREDALRLAEQLDIPVTVLELDILQDAQIVANPKNRCYFCKKRIFTAICNAARAAGYPLVIDGTNADDDCADRPGMQALTELGVHSPLRKAGLTKQQIRRLSKAAGLFTHNKPAYACLATRIPTGSPITALLLDKTERSEEFLKGLGFTDFRIRYFDGSARIQIKENQLPLLLKHRQTILDKLQQDYTAVLMDLEVRP